MANGTTVEKQKTLRRTVLTSLSMLLSSNCALANTGGFASHSQAPASSWTPPAQQSGAATASFAATAPASPFGNVQHLPSASVLPHQATPVQHSAWQNFGLPSASLTPLTNGNFDLPTGGYQLDLTSTVANVVLGSQMFNGAPSVNLDVAGQTMSFRPGTQVTPAQYVAIREVLGGGQQNLVLTDSGSAAGGSFTLNRAVTPQVSQLVIPQNVSALDYLTNSQPITIHGGLVNYGSIFGISTDPSVTSGSLFARDITNQSGALISTQLPGSMAASIGSTVSGVSLVLGAYNSLTNSGTISSAGTLTLATVNGAITNNAGALASAAQNVNLISGSGDINNSGAVTAASGNINMAALNGATNLNINAAGGTFTAANAININAVNYADAAEINMNGGDYRSKELNIYGGDGAITGSVGDVTGALSSYAKVAHFAADTETLTLGTNCIKGDPTYANTGDINIAGNVTVSEDLTILAGGNITGSPGITLSTANTEVPGVNYNPSTNITIIAGAKVTTDGNETSTVPIPPGIGNGKFAIVDFSAGKGGNIALAGVNIDTSSDRDIVPPSPTYNQPNGGNVLLAAYSGVNGAGIVAIGNITTTSKNGNGGNVTIISGRNDGDLAVDTGNILTGSTASNNLMLGRGGDVSIFIQQPGSADGGTITYASNGAAVSGRVVPSGTIQNGFVRVQSIDTAHQQFYPSNTSTVGGDIKILGGKLELLNGGTISSQGEQSGSITIDVMGAIISNGGTITSASTTNGAPGSSGNITIKANTATLGQVLAGNSAVGNGTATAGNICIATNSDLSTGKIDASGNSNTLDGDIIINSGGQLTINSTTGNAMVGRNILISGINGIYVTAAGGAATVDILASGAVTAVAGSLANSATLKIDGGITTTAARPGNVLLVNNAKTPDKTAAASLTVGGTITTDSLAQNGTAGSVSVVSSGGIKLGNISAKAVAGVSSSSSQGGGVFISSGGLGTNAITTGTVNTSVLKSSGNQPGQVMMISVAATKTGLNPSNIKHGTVTSDGVVKALPFYAGLFGISDDLPITLNIIPTIGGATPINIRPGGYQKAQDTFNGFGITSINNPYATLVAPINIASNADSTFGFIAQKNSVDNFSLVTSGKAIFAQSLSTSVATSSTTLIALGGIESSNSANIQLNSGSRVMVMTHNNEIIVPGLKINAFNDVVVAGTINATSAVTGGSVIVHSEIGGVTTSNIFTAGIGGSSIAGSVAITANSIINTGHIDASSYDGLGGLNEFGAGGVLLQAGTIGNFNGQGVRTGNISNTGDNLIRIASYGNSSVIKTGDLTSTYFDLPELANITIHSGGYVSTGDINTSSPSHTGGGVNITEGRIGASIGSINTSSNAGFDGGNVYIFGSGGNTTINVLGINTSVSGSTENGSGGNIVVTNAGGNFTWGPGALNASANYSSTGTGSGGNVVVSASGNLYGYGVDTSVRNVGSTGNGGNVFISGNSLWMSTIDTSAFAPGMVSGTGGSVTLSTGSGGTDLILGMNMTSVTTKGIDQGGFINETSQGFIVHAGTLDTSSVIHAGNISSVSNGFTFLNDVNASATNLSGFATGGNVMVVTAGNFFTYPPLVINGTLNTSATTDLFDATAGSIGIANGSNVVQLVNLNASATSTNATSTAGDIFISSPTGVTGSANINTTASTSGTKFAGVTYAGSTDTNNIKLTPVGTSVLNKFSNSTNSISGPSATISFASGVTNIRSSSYDSVGTSSSKVNLTLDFGGDSRLLVPILSNGGIYVGSVSGNNTKGAGTAAYQNAGYGIHLININQNALNDLQISGNVAAKQNGFGGPDGDVQLVNLFGSISQSDATKVISAPNLYLTSYGQVGAITTGGNGYTQSPIYTDATRITANALSRGSINANVFINVVGNGSTTFTGINTAGGNAHFDVNTTNAGINIDGLVFGAQSNWVGTNAVISVAAGGTIIGYNNSSSLTFNSPAVSNLGFISSGQVLIETINLTNVGAITTTKGALTLAQSTYASTALTLTNTGTLTSPTQLTLAATGQVDMTGLISNNVLSLAPGESLFILSGQAITSTTGGNFSINTSSSTGDAGNVALLSGVKFNLDNSSGSPVITIDTDDYIGGTGGIKLDGSFTADVLTSINTTSASGAGGNILILAAAPAGQDAPILLGGTTINSGGATRNGEVALIALGLDLTKSSFQYGVKVGDVTSGTFVNHLGSGGIDLETGTLKSGQTITLAGGTFDSGYQTVMPETVIAGRGKVGSGMLETNLGYLYGGAVDNLDLHFNSVTLNAYDIELTSTDGTVIIPVETIVNSPPDPSQAVISVGSYQDGSGNGGTIKINAQSINFNGVSLFLGADATGPFGNGGTIEITTADDSLKGFGFPNAGYIQAFARGGQNGGNGGSIKMHTDATVEIDNEWFSAAVTAPNGNGPTYDFASIHFTDDFGATININASGKGTGNGGRILLEEYSQIGANIKAPTYLLTATSGLLGGNGGQVSFTSAGSLRVEPSAIKVNPLGSAGNGGKIRLVAGQAATGQTLVVTAPLVVSGKGATGQGGSIIVSSSSNIPFLIGAKTEALTGGNGIVGMPVAAGKPLGQFTAENRDGDVKTLVALTAFQQTYLHTDNAGSIILGANVGNSTAKTNTFLAASGSGTITNTLKTVVALGDYLSVFSKTGDIVGVTTGPVPAPTPFTVSANYLNINGKNVNLSLKTAANLVGCNVSDTLTLTSTKNITTNSVTINAPTLNLITTGIVAADAKGLVPAYINTSKLSVSNGTFNLQNLSTTQIDVKSVSKAKALSLLSSADIFVPGSIGATTTNITFTTSNNKSINTDVASGMIIGKDVNLSTIPNSGSTGGIGDKSAIRVNAVNVSAVSGTSVNMNVFAATTTLGDIQANNGNVDINTAGSVAKVLQTRAATTKVFGSIIHALNGHVTIQNNNVTKGSIIIGKNTNITTDTKTGGDVTISIGQVITPVAGPQPAGIVYYVDDVLQTPPPPPGLFFFGTNGITVAGTSATPGKETINMNSKGGAKVIFSTGALPKTAIKINGNTPLAMTRFTADPPIVTPAVSLPVVLSPTLDNSFAPANLTNGAPIQLVNTSTPISTPTLATVPTIAPLQTIPANQMVQSIQQAPAFETVSLSNIAAAQQSNLLNASASRYVAAQDSRWATETELTNGEIPAIVYCEEDLGVGVEHSAIVEMQTARDSKHVTLNRGTVVFAPTSDTVVETPMGSISVGADSVVLVTVNGQGTAVYDLDDARHNSVRVTTARGDISLSPGRHLMLTNRMNAAFADVNQAQMIGYRNIREHSHTDNIKAFTADFAVQHAVAVVQPVKKMFSCKNNRSRKLSTHMLKTMSIMMSLDGGKGNYQQMLKPKLTAWAP